MPLPEPPPEDAVMLPAGTYSGSTVLSSRATINLARQIDAYLADHPEDPAASELQQIGTLFASRRILSQALSGFRRAPRARRAAPFRRLPSL